MMESLLGREYMDDKNSEVVAVTPEEAQRWNNNIMELVQKINYSMQILARMISEFRDKKMYIALGYKSFREWYVDQRIPHTTVYRALTVSDFIEKYQLPESAMSLPQKKLDMLSSLDKKGVINEKNVEEWVRKAVEDTESDFIMEYRKAKATAPIQPIPPGTYIMKRVEGEDGIDVFDDRVKNIGKYYVYKKEDGGGEVFFVKVAPNE